MNIAFLVVVKQLNCAQRQWIALLQAPCVVFCKQGQNYNQHRAQNLTPSRNSTGQNTLGPTVEKIRMNFLFSLEAPQEVASSEPCRKSTGQNK
jgi:hypothetical protein